MNWCGKWVITCTAQYVDSPLQAGGVLAEWISRGCCCSSCSKSEEEIVFFLGLAAWSLKSLSTFWTELEEKLFQAHSPPSPSCSTPYASRNALSGRAVGGVLATVILIFTAFILALWYYVGKGNGVPFSLCVLQKACSKWVAQQGSSRILPTRAIHLRLWFQLHGTKTTPEGSPLLPM